MTSLLDLIDPPPIIDVDTSKLPLADRWPTWLAANEALVSAIERMAVSALHAGARRFSTKAAFERLRASVPVVDRGKYALNNSWTAFVADELIRRRPELARIIERRKRSAR